MIPLIDWAALQSFGYIALLGGALIDPNQFASERRFQRTACGLSRSPEPRDHYQCKRQAKYDADSVVRPPVRCVKTTYWSTDQNRVADSSAMPYGLIAEYVAVYDDRSGSEQEGPEKRPPDPEEVRLQIHVTPTEILRHEE